MELGRNVFIDSASRFLLTAVDLPVISRAIERKGCGATVKRIRNKIAPHSVLREFLKRQAQKLLALAMSIKLEMHMVRELLSREEIEVARAPSDAPGMAIGETTAEFLRRLPPVGRPASTRDRLPNPPERGRSTPSSHCYAGRLEPTDGKSDRLDEGQLREAAAGGRDRTNSGDERVDAAPPFPRADRHEPSSVSETASVAGSAGTHAHGWSGRSECGLCGRIRKRESI